MQIVRIKIFYYFCLFFSHYCSATIVNDLEINKIFEVINYTVTKHGKEKLHNLLLSPTDDITVLTNRQKIIQECHNNHKLMEQLKNGLTTFSSYEPIFEKIVQKTSSIQNTSLQQFYFTNNYFRSWNSSPLGLELGIVAHLGNLASSITQHFLTYLFFKHACCDNHDHSGNKKSHSHNKFLKKFLKKLKTPMEYWHFLAQIQELYAIQSIMRHEFSLIKQMHKELINLASGIRTIKKIHTLLNNQPNITRHLTLYSHIDALCKMSTISHELKQLLYLLEKPTFSQKTSFFSRIGNILAAHRLMQNTKNELLPALNAVGELDAFVSCAQLLKKYQSSSTPYTFAQYLSHYEPTIVVHNFWHPLLTQKITFNSITLSSENNTRNLILSAPNASGKSTSLKSLVLCAYLAQTITLVPAYNYSQTLFKEIYSSMNISDDIKNNASLFITELQNAENLLNKINNLKPHEFMLIALDELFTSTHHQKGEMVAFNFLKQIYRSTNILSLITTHFEHLTELAATEKYCCTNYTIDNFVLKPGKGRPDSSFDLLHKRKISILLE